MHNTTTNFIRNQINADLSNNLHQKIQLRFPPEPNGFLHIGHAKSIFLNFGLAKDYNGKCNLRFDDTNPDKENIKYINAIKDDISWLGFKWDKLTYTSDYFDKFYDYAIELIEKNLAYVCFLTTSEIKDYRGTLTKIGKNSPYRNTKVKENLINFKKMKNGEFKAGECVLRLKIDMSSNFMIMRDPSIYRIKFSEHYQTKNKWCIYPMYDFAHPVSDGIEKITHSLCTLEFQDNRRLYDWILTNLVDFNQPNRPHQYEFSRLNLAWTMMSKRKINTLVASEKISGWDDPRLPSISGLRCRGYTPNSIKEFIKKIGISKIDSLTDIKILEDSVRDDLNLNAKRSMAVIEPIEIEITNFDEKLIELIAPNHPQNPEFGNRKIYFSKFIYIDKNDFMVRVPNNKYKRLAIDKEVRLRNAFIIKANSFELNNEGEVIKIYATYNRETLGKNPSDGRKVKGVIHFVEKTTAINAKFKIYARLFNVEKPTEDSEINPNSLIVKHGFVEKNIQNTKQFTNFQFERAGYFCLNNSEKMIFNKIVSLRDTWNK